MKIQIKKSNIEEVRPGEIYEVKSIKDKHFPTGEDCIKVNESQITLSSLFFEWIVLEEESEEILINGELLDCT